MNDIIDVFQGIVQCDLGHRCCALIQFMIIIGYFQTFELELFDSINEIFSIELFVLCYLMFFCRILKSYAPKRKKAKIIFRNHE